MTGLPGADIDHFIPIGRGFNRNEVDHSKYLRMALIRSEHNIKHTMDKFEYIKMRDVRPIYSKWHNDVIDELDEDLTNE